MSSPEEPQPGPTSPGPPRLPDGPRSVALDLLLRGLGLPPATLEMCEREDVGEGDWIAAMVRYWSADGGGINVTLQEHPPGSRILGDWTLGGRISIPSWPTGTQYVVRETGSAPTDTIQVISRRADRLVLQITCSGASGKNVPRVLSRDEVINLTQRADSALAR